jgi:hypothetical protein
MNDMLSYFGTIASIFGAIFALWQSHKASNSASEARKIYDVFISKRELSELKELQISHKKVLAAISKYGPGSTPSNLAGINSSKDANIIQDYIIKIKEYCKYFNVKNKNSAIMLCQTITPILANFAKSNTDDELRNFGALLFDNISNFSSILKEKIDDRENNF